MEIKKGDVFKCESTITIDGTVVFVAENIYASEKDGTITNELGKKARIPAIYTGNFSRVKSVSTESQTDPVNSPSHYTQGKIESIDAIESALGAEGFKGFLAGNAMKYVHRYRHKNGIEDVKKARWYIDRLIKTLENEGT